MSSSIVTPTAGFILEAYILKKSASSSYCVSYTIYFLYMFYYLFFTFCNLRFTKKKDVFKVSYWDSS